MNWFCLLPKLLGPFDWGLLWTPNPKGLGFWWCCCCEAACVPNPMALDFGCCWEAWRNLHLSPYWQLEEEKQQWQKFQTDIQLITIPSLDPESPFNLYKLFRKFSKTENEKRLLDCGDEQVKEWMTWRENTRWMTVEGMNLLQRLIVGEKKLPAALKISAEFFFKLHLLLLCLMYTLITTGNCSLSLILPTAPLNPSNSWPAKFGFKLLKFIWFL